ncbi:MAG: hypothetical protein D6807_03165 [Alphaproteobacteria bacterium]|nr:MAG: hypothetical protein D6807_03165 [Alphaproteobacteria bacterium]
MEPIGFGALFRRATVLVRANLEMFVLLAALWTILNAALALPAQGRLAPLLERIRGATDPQVIWQAFGDMAPLLLYLMGLGIVIFGLVAVVWVRSIALGRHAALAPGFVRRALAVMRRNLAFILYAVVLGVAILILAFLLKAVVGLAVVAFGETVGAVVRTVLLLVLVLLAFTGFLALISGFLVVSAAVTVDRAASLFETATEILRANRTVIFAYSFLLVLAVIATLAGDAAFGLEEGAMPSLWQTVVTGFFGSAFNLFALAMGLVAMGGDREAGEGTAPV